MLKSNSADRLQTGTVGYKLGTKKCGHYRNSIGHGQFAIIFRNTNHKRDRNKRREIEKILSCTQTFHNAYDDQVKIKSSNTKYSCQSEFMTVVTIDPRHENNGGDHIY